MSSIETFLVLEQWFGESVGCTPFTDREKAQTYAKTVAERMNNGPILPLDKTNDAEGTVYLRYDTDHQDEPTRPAGLSDAQWEAAETDFAYDSSTVLEYACNGISSYVRIIRVDMNPTPVSTPQITRVSKPVKIGGEWQVKAWVGADGMTRYPDGDYYTTDKQDAIDSAAKMVSAAVVNRKIG